MAKITEDDLLDSIAKEIQSKHPQPGEITVATFIDEMKKRGTILTDDMAAYWLNRMVKEGKLVVRYGIINRKRGRIFSKRA